MRRPQLAVRRRDDDSESSEPEEEEGVDDDNANREDVDETPGPEEDYDDELLNKEHAEEAATRKRKHAKETAGRSGAKKMKMFVEIITDKKSKGNDEGRAKGKQRHVSATPFEDDNLPDDYLYPE